MAPAIVMLWIQSPREGPSSSLQLSTKKTTEHHHKVSAINTSLRKIQNPPHQGNQPVTHKNDYIEPFLVRINVLD